MQVHRKRLSNGSDPTAYEDLSESIQSGMAALGFNLTDPLGIALDLRDRKVRGQKGSWEKEYRGGGMIRGRARPCS